MKTSHLRRPLSRNPALRARKRAARSAAVAGLGVVSWSTLVQRSVKTASIRTISAPLDTLHVPPAAQYEGSFDSGRFSGDGTYTYPDGR